MDCRVATGLKIGGLFAHAIQRTDVVFRTRWPASGHEGTGIRLAAVPTHWNLGTRSVQHVPLHRDGPWQCRDQCLHVLGHIVTREEIPQIREAALPVEVHELDALDTQSSAAHDMRLDGCVRQIL